MAKGFDSFESDNDRFEDWLKARLKKRGGVDEAGLKSKHKKMSGGPFAFLRGTYFRWAKTIEQLCTELEGAPNVLAVGDIHIENFGTWRNVDQRLVWGINDFDEAARMPYAFDLVRLVTSARLATEEVKKKKIAEAVLNGYRRGLEKRRATLLDQEQTWMNDFLRTTEDERLDFGIELETLQVQAVWKASEVPARARRSLIEALPKDLKAKFVTRKAGVGSLGRFRFVAIAKWHNALVVREAKAQLPSAWDWAHGKPDAKSRLVDAAWSCSRSPDPYLQADGHFVIRRLAADTNKINVEDLAPHALQADLFEAMGSDLGAFHASNQDDVHAIKKDLNRRDNDWLDDAADAAEEQVLADFAEWEQVINGKKSADGKKKEKEKENAPMPRRLRRI
jgi:hypothetical protein